MRTSITLIVALISISSCYSQTADEYYKRGLAKSNLQDYRGAIADYTKAIELNPAYSDVYINRGNAPAHSNAYYNRGTTKNDLEDYRGAIADYNKSIELNPDFSDAYYNSGQAKYRLQDYQGAIYDYSKAIELKPDFLAYYNRGLNKFNLQDYRGAIADYNKAIELKPDYMQFYFSRGLAKIAIGQKDNGCLDLSKAGELGHPKAYDTIKELCN